MSASTTNSSDSTRRSSMSDDSTGPQKDLAMAPIARQENYNYAQNLLNVDGYLTHKVYWNFNRLLAVLTRISLQTSVKEQQSDLQSIFLCQLQHLKNSRNKWISSNVNKSNVYCIDQPLHFSSSSDVNFTEVSYEKSPSMQSAQSHDAANYSVLSATEDVVYKVQYKTCSRYHVRSPYFSSRFPQDGDFVIVEGDRGVDLGMVVGVVSLDQYYRLVHLGGSSLGKIEEGKILRLATIRETQQMPLKSRGEENVARVSFMILFLYIPSF